MSQSDDYGQRGYGEGGQQQGQPYPGQQQGWPGGQSHPGGQQQPSYPGQQQQHPGQQQNYPGQQQGYPGQQQYPGQQHGYPGQQQGYPGQQQGYPGQQQAYPGQQQGYPGQPYPGASGRPGAAPSPFSLIAIGAAVLLLISTFLPWVSAKASGSVGGQAITSSARTASGFEDWTGKLTALAAVAAIGVLIAGVVTKNARLGLIAIAPGALAAIFALIFLLRLAHVKNQLSETGLPSGIDVNVSLSYGWFLALLLSVAVIGLNLVGVLTAKKPAAAPAPY
jgi:hypothetical protein